MVIPFPSMPLQAYPCTFSVYTLVDFALHASFDTVNEKYYQLKPRQSTGYLAANLIDIDFADDIYLISQSFANAQSLLAIS